MEQETDIERSKNSGRPTNKFKGVFACLLRLQFEKGLNRSLYHFQQQHKRKDMKRKEKKHASN